MGKKDLNSIGKTLEIIEKNSVHTVNENTNTETSNLKKTAKRKNTKTYFGLETTSKIIYLPKDYIKSFEQWQQLQKEKVIQPISLIDYIFLAVKEKLESDGIIESNNKEDSLV